MRMELLLQPARVNTRPVVSERHAYVRNAVAIESAHAWRVIAPPARNIAHTLNTLARAFRFCFPCS